MSSYSFSREDMVEPIERMFDREISSGFGMFEVIADVETEGGSGNVDLIYVTPEKEGLHVIRIEESFDDTVYDVTRGIHTLSDVEANYLWIALPLDEFRDGEEKINNILTKTCRDRGYGIITLQPKGRGISAKAILEPAKKPGKHLSKYGDLAERWRAATKNELADEQYKPVEYYK